MFNFQLPYNREKILYFLEGFLPDDFVQDEREIPSNRSFEKIRQIVKLGSSAVLGSAAGFPLTVYEALHKSEQDPRVSLTREMFGLMRDHLIDRALIVFYSLNSQNYRFSLMKIDVEPKGRRIKTSFSNPRRFSFYLGPDAKTHTPEQFLLKKGKVRSFEELMERFNVEVVTKEFYQELANWYFWALENVKFPKQAEEQPNGKSISVIRLITRLIFIWFMKKRGLMPEYLFNQTELEKILKNISFQKSTYYKAILQNLFFATLNTPIAKRRFTYQKNYKGINKDYGINDIYRYEENFKHPRKILKLFKNIPFLNGGLFECLDKKTERIIIDGFSRVKKNQPHVPNFLFFNEKREIDLNKEYGTKNKKYLVQGLINLLNLYNFTVDENTSAEVEISVDPEMLGRIFENLLAQINPETGKSARKSTGSYYTPRIIVEYMVNESLKLYLQHKIEVSKEKINFLLAYTYNDQDLQLSDQEIDSIIEALHQIKIIDPACGSGAFPMGVLQKMLLILQKIDPNAQKWSAKQLVEIQDIQKREETENKFKNESRNYVHKIGIIQNAIYGVDIQPIAIEISKLRFFLSLIVDAKIYDHQKNYGLEPLPNLEFKFVCANSLISLPEDKGQGNMFENVKDIEKLKVLRDEYLQSWGSKKKRIEKEFTELQQKMVDYQKIMRGQGDKTLKLSRWKPFSNEPSAWFDPEWMFGIKEGFDIVIGNPPYGANIDDYIKLFEELYPETSKNFKDIYKYFFNCSLAKLTSKNGVLCFITPNTFFLQPRYGDLRKYLLEYNILSLINLGENVFETVVPTAISLIKGSKANAHNKIKFSDISDVSKYPGSIFDLNFIKIQQNTFLETPNNIFTENIRIKLDDEELLENVLNFKDAGINYQRVNVGLSDKGNSDLSERLLYKGQKEKESHVEYWKGADINAFYISPETNRFVRPDIRLKENERVILNKDYFNYTPKLLWRQTASIPIAVVDRVGIWFGRSIQSGVIKNIFSKELSYEYLCCLLNSSYIRKLYEKNVQEGGRVFPQVKLEKLKRLPIKIISLEKQKPFIAIVNKILAITKADDYLQNPAKQEQVKKYEKQIDQIVYKLYSLMEEEIKIVENLK